MTKVSEVDKQVQKLAKEFSASNSKIDDLSKKITGNSRELDSLEKNLEENKLVVESINRAVESSNTKVQSLADQITLFKSDIGKEIQNSGPKNNGLSSLSESVAMVNQKLDSFRTELSRVNESIFLLRSDGKEFSEKLGEHDTDLADTKSKIESVASGSLPGITNKLETFETEFQSWGDKIHALSESVSAISPQIQAMTKNNGSSDSVAEQLQVISQRLDGLEKGMAENSFKIGELQGSVSLLAKRMTSVEFDYTAPELMDKF